MTAFARCGVCDMEGQWSSPEYRDAWLRWHYDQTGHDDPFCMDFPDEPLPQRRMDRSDALAARVRKNIQRQRENRTGETT